MHPGILIAATLALPLAMLAACVSPRLRGRMLPLLAFAPLPAVAAALQAFDDTTLVLPPALLGLTFEVDRSGGMLLGASALLWVAAGAYAATLLRDKPDSGRFVVWWLMTLTGSLGVFIAADLVGFYLFFTVVSLAAYGLVVFDETSTAQARGRGIRFFGPARRSISADGLRAARAANPNGSLLIRDAAVALATSPWRNATLIFLALGFALKIGTVPLHVWMPLAYTAAPIPAAAVLSGAAVKAGVIFVRFIPFQQSLPGWGMALVAAGLFSAFYGVLIGITQSNPKTVLAYSSVSQMGLLAAVVGVGLGSGDATVGPMVIFYAVHHTLAKGGLFLAIGAGAQTKGRGLWLVLLPAAVLALGLGGLPLTGGALAKLAAKTALGDGIVGTLATLSAIGSTVLMLHFLFRLVASSERDEPAALSVGLVWPWLAIAFCAVALPWALYPRVAGASLSEAFAPKELWSALWPVLIGGLLAVGLRRWGHLLPRIPAGDILAWSGGAMRAVGGAGMAIESIDRPLRQWSVAGLLFMALTIVLALAMLGGSLAWR